MEPRRPGPEPLWHALGALAGSTLVTRRGRGFRVLALRADHLLIAWVPGGPRRRVPRKWLEAAPASPPGRGPQSAKSVVAALLEELRWRPTDRLSLIAAVVAAMEPDAAGAFALLPL